MAIRRGPEKLTGSLRIKVPLTLSMVRLERPLLQFARDHPDVNLEILLMDGPLNPAAEGVDIAVTAFPATFDHVIDEFLWPLKRSLYASPAYLESQAPMQHPRTLDHMDALVYQPTGATWSFLGDSGVVSVTVNAKLTSNNMPMLVRAAEEGAGVGLFSDYVAADAESRGSLVRVLLDFPVPDLWIKAMIPEGRLPLPRVQAALQMLKALNGKADPVP
jgi:DNA-binding transcriptional LysR family regulator